MIRYRRREKQHTLNEMQFYFNEWSTMMEWVSKSCMRGCTTTEQDWLKWGHIKFCEWFGIHPEWKDYDSYEDEFEFDGCPWDYDNADLEDEAVPTNIQSEDRQYV